MTLTYDLTDIIEHELVPYISHLRGFVAELSIKKLLEKYANSQEKLGNCIIARTEFCANTRKNIIARLLDLYVPIPGRPYKGDIRFEGVWFNKGLLLPKNVKIIRRKTYYTRKTKDGNLQEINEVECVDPGEYISSILLNDNYRTDYIKRLCSITLDGERLVNSIKSEKACFVHEKEFINLLDEIECLTTCFRQQGHKTCFDYFVINISPKNEVNGYLIEVKTSKDDAKELLYDRNHCMKKCKPNYLDVSIVYVAIDMIFLRSRAKIEGASDWIKG
ncbi:MAG: hypothetical protein F7C36_00645 [Desulfurococcales archaeon]|nr:hypothetical protein [Desulfurococcales archaeon]